MQTWLSGQSKQLQVLKHRQLIWLAGDHHWAWQIINPWLAEYKNNTYVGQADLRHAFLNCVKASKPTTLLGYESDNVVFDAHHGLFPDALTAIAGTIKPGGFLFLLTPPLDEYPEFADEFAMARTSFGFEDKCNNKHTIERLLSSAQQHNAIVLEQAKPAQKWPPEPESNATLTSVIQHIKDTEEQLYAFKRILDDFITCPSHPDLHIITADRGRGKSHLLGILSKALIEANNDNGINYYLCAPNRAATSAVYKHLDENIKQKLQFIAPERLMDSAHQNDIVLIDEAASISVPTLIEWGQHFTHLIMATTTHGYEGTGKGFQIRFFSHLNKQQNRTWQQHTLKEPIRYAANDPIESWLFDVFCLDSEPSQLDLTQPNTQRAIKEASCVYISKKNLLAAPDILKQVFALLVQAHYQTKPSDLRDLLDAPGLRLFAQIIEIDDQLHVIGVCLINDEGPMANPINKQSDLHQDIFNGYRRPKGHLIPQVLAHHMGLHQALTLKGARIVRIATLENYQRQGLGSRMIKAVKQYCVSKEYDYLGSSFADTDDVRHFWFKNEFKLIRQGNKLDKASGTQSALVLYGLSRQGLDLEENAMLFFNRQWQKVSSPDELKSEEQTLLQAFLEHSGSYESAKVILRRFTQWEDSFPKKASKEFKQDIQNWLDEL